MKEQELKEILANIAYDQDGYVTLKNLIQMTKQLKNLTSLKKKFYSKL